MKHENEPSLRNTGNDDYRRQSMLQKQISQRDCTFRQLARLALQVPPR
ncbi:MAG: hypothetical protein WCR23_11825 [Planctomycetota bacterium]